MDRLQYLDFELKVEREGDHYAARVLRSPVGEAASTFALPFSEDRMALLVLKLSGTRSRTRAIRSAEIEAARELGGKLFEAVFTGEVRDRLRSSLDEAQRQEGTGLRLKLRLQDAAELADLPWEYLYDSSLDRFIAQSNQTPVVRYIEMPERIKPFTTQLPLRVLVMVSSPNDPDYPPLDVERENAMLQQALDPLSRSGQVHVQRVERPTLASLQHCLQGGPFHIFHFIGHGGFDKSTEEGVLVLEDEQRRGVMADAHRIGTLLHDHRSLRLAVLNSCEGARNSRTDPFAGVATTLIRQGIPAVVAMQFEITDEAAITFAGEFYAALANGFPIDAAVAEGRKAIYLRPNDVEWGTPVLFTRAPDGVLFEVTGSPQPEVQRPQTPEERQPVEPPAPRQSPPDVQQPRRPEVPPPAGPESRGLSQTPSPAAPAGQNLATKMFNVIEERSIEIDVTSQVLRDRLMKWTQAVEFKCTVDTPNRWEFQRGNILDIFNPLTAFNRSTTPAEVVVELAGGRPATVRASMKLKGRGSYNWSTRGDRKYLNEQLDLLLAGLRGTQ